MLTKSMPACAVPETVVNLTVTGVASSVSWPEIAQTVTVPSSSVTLDALPINLTSGTPEIPVGGHPASHVSPIQSTILIHSLR